MKILSGVQSPSSGSVVLDGAPVRLQGVRHALSLGIAMIHQELDVIDDLTVAENVFLGSEPRRGLVIDRGLMRSQTSALLSRVGASFSPSALVGELSIAGKQLVEIAKALSHEAKYLIMDEPTAVLTERETDSLFRLIFELKAQGVGVIYISHRLAEVEKLCDRVSVLRDGRLVSTLARGSFDQVALAKLMVGRELGDFYPPLRSSVPGEVLLSVTGAVVPGFVHGVDFSVRAGEIVGLAGLVGSGRTELCEAIVGARRLVSGSIEVGGVACSIPSVRDAVRRGLAYVSEDRKGMGLVLGMDVVENTTLASLRSFCKPLVSKKSERECADRWVKELDVRAGDLRADVLFLSGGNQQKVAVAKWLETKPRVLILDEPTRGVDVGAKREIYNLIQRLADEGMACVVISSELPEIVGVCERVVVVREGRVAGELVGSEITEEAIVLRAAGVAA
jgi:ribose transport system ATP-binding protein